MSTQAPENQQPDPDGPLNPHAPELDLDVPVPASPAETAADEEDEDGPEIPD
ncbi:hypothetical protein ACFFTK_19265 [Pseudonocardia petroleophila]|uniref:Uncharacterized protein n=1 Tax=Pseudonocardia petroleophila TaxID=37331 RepID=A0A7G7MEA7_9PSEU|nr:hypothetical protein [Pseudonocardia petroleophila]QNG51118.1 hypothetical protein H6H00_23550 [Pseudonocardia petroleophila]